MKKRYILLYNLLFSLFYFENKYALGIFKIDNQSIPYASVLCFATTAITIIFYVTARNCINKVSQRFNELWKLLFILCSLNGVFSIICEGNDSPEILILGLLFGLAYIVAMVVLGYKISNNFSGRIRTLGKVFMFAPGICILLTILTLLYAAYRITQDDWTVPNLAHDWTLRFLIFLITLSEVSPIFACIEVIRKSEDNTHSDTSSQEDEGNSEFDNSQQETVTTRTTNANNIHERHISNDRTAETGNRNVLNCLISVIVFIFVIIGAIIWIATRNENAATDTDEEVYLNDNEAVYKEDDYVNSNNKDEDEYDIVEPLEADEAPPHKLKVTAINGATDPLPPHKTTTYGASHLIDDDPKTGWAIKFKPSENTESPIWGPEIILKEKATVDYIIINNGYGKSSELFKRNTRPAWITIYRPIAPDTGDPEPSDILYDGPLADKMQPQKLTVNADFDKSVPVERVVIKLPRYSAENYYDGTLYEHLVISEIEFWGN